jgi:predicted acyl esterase
VYETPTDVVKHHDVAVTMTDGVVLRVNVYRPEGDGPFPVILCAHPYGKDALPRKKRRGWSFSPQYRIMNQPQAVRFSDQTSWEAPDPAWWVAHGYVVVNADTRGGGHSDGVGDLFSDQEAHDIARLIEWAGSQPWSTGNVGMLGVSYLAISQYKAAALHPPALKAICPWEGFTDAYRDIFTTGGIPENGFARIWLFMTKRVARVATDLAAGRREHPLRDEWWEALTPDLADITVPMLVCASFSDDNRTASGPCARFSVWRRRTASRTCTGDRSGPRSTERTPAARSSSSSTATSRNGMCLPRRGCDWRSATRLTTSSRCAAKTSGRWLAPGGRPCDSAKAERCTRTMRRTTRRREA